jgi:hypothetical protein
MKAAIVLSSIAILAYYGLCSVPTGFAQKDTAELESTWKLTETVAVLDGAILQTALRYRLHKVQKGEVLLPGRETLRSLVAISGVKVFMSPELERCGLKIEALKTAVELQLRRNGIAVDEFPSDPNEQSKWFESHKAEGMWNTEPLHVYIDSISSDQTDVVGVDVAVSQSQRANLLSTAVPTTVLAETWHQSQLILGRRSNVATGCREAISELLEKYCNDWLATHMEGNGVKPTHGYSGDSIEWRSVKAVITYKSGVVGPEIAGQNAGSGLSGPPFGTAYSTQRRDE